jgi:hypothetical protein
VDQAAQHAASWEPIDHSGWIRPCDGTCCPLVRKSRNSSGGLYRCRRRSAHDRRRTNAVRFLMNTLIAHPIPLLMHVFRQNPLWTCSGSPRLSSCPLRTPALTIRAYWRGAITALNLLAPIQSCSAPQQIRCLLTQRIRPTHREHGRRRLATDGPASILNLCGSQFRLLRNDQH